MKFTPRSIAVRMIFVARVSDSACPICDPPTPRARNRFAWLPEAAIQHVSAFRFIWE